MENISEILKNAPKGLLLYSPIVGYVNLVEVKDKVGKRGVIKADVLFRPEKSIEFDSFGRYSVDDECMLFPSKFNKNWDNWQNDMFSFGDFITNIDGYKKTFVIYNVSGRDTCDAYDSNGSKTIISKTEYRWATDEEKNGFLSELERNGFTWNTATNEIEIKPEPKTDHELDESEKICIAEELSNAVTVDEADELSEQAENMLRQKSQESMETEKIIKLAREIYKKTLSYELDSLQVNDDGTTAHMHSDKFLDEHPERMASPEFTDEEEKEQAQLIATVARTFYNGKTLFDN